MANKKSGKQKTAKILSIVIPMIIAIAVIIALAVSGHITKQKDQVTPTVTQSTTITTQPEVPKDTKVTLVSVGDNLIHNTLIAAGKQEDGSLNYDSFYQDIKPYISAADIACIDQETILGGKDFEYTGYPVFNSPWEVGEAAINAGFDVFECASNHSMDKGSAGVEKEKEFFAKHPEVTQIGTNLSEEEYNKITYIEKNDLKIALLNYTYGTNGIPLPEDKPWLINLIDEDKITKDIKTARKNADVVIVFPHWGDENSNNINDMQKKYVKLFSQLGVDAVISCHPHVLQPVEWVANEKTGKKMIVYYSIGNFISHQIELPQMCGGMAELTFERKNGVVTVSSAKLAPVIDYYKNTGNGYAFSTYKYCDYNDDLASTQAQSGATKEYFTKLVKGVIDEEFLDLE